MGFGGFLGFFGFWVFLGCGFVRLEKPRNGVGGVQKLRFEV